MNGVALWLAVGLLGGAGAVARLLVDRLVSARLAGAFPPAGTLAVNLSGSVALGLLSGAALRGDARLLAATALLGAYTTFSTWMLETRELAASGRRIAAAVNALAGAGLGLAAVALGRLAAGG